MTKTRDKAPAPIEVPPPTAEGTGLEELRQEIAAELPPPPPRPEPVVESIDAEGGDDGAEEALIDTLEDFDANPEKLATLTGEDWADIWEVLFELCAAILGDHWALERSRALRLGKITKRAEARYGGITGSFAKHIPLVVLILLLGATISKRVKITRDLKNPPLRLHPATEPVVAEEPVTS